MCKQPVHLIASEYFESEQTFQSWLLLFINIYISASDLVG